MPLTFSAAIFDMDGTLFGTEQIAIDALQAAFAEHGVEVAPQSLQTVIGRAGKESRELLSRLLPAGVGIDELLERGRDFIEARIAAEGIPIKPGVVELLAYLRHRGVAMGLATSTRGATALGNLRRANLVGYFRTVIGGDQVEKQKPHPDVYLRALAELGVAPDDAIAVEDSDFGIQAASAAGLRVVHVPDVKRIEARTKALVHREYATLRELLDELVSGA